MLIPAATFLNCSGHSGPFFVQVLFFYVFYFCAFKRSGSEGNRTKSAALPMAETLPFVLSSGRTNGRE